MYYIETAEELKKTTNTTAEKQNSSLHNQVSCNVNATAAIIGKCEVMKTVQKTKYISKRSHR